MGSAAKPPEYGEVSRMFLLKLTIYVTDRQTDRRTDRRHAIAIDRALPCSASRGKNVVLLAGLKNYRFCKK